MNARVAVSVVIVVVSCGGSCFFIGDNFSCTSDAECAPNQCDLTTNTCVGREGEGEGGDVGCAAEQASFAQPDGNGSLAEMTCSLVVDTRSATRCALSLPRRVDVVCDLGGYVVTGDCAQSGCAGTELAIADGAGTGEPHECTTPPVVVDGKVQCAMCYATLPAHIAAQFTDQPGDDRSNAVCVSTP